jgi:hypothetical protein
VWGLLTTLAAWTIGPRSDNPGPLEVLTVEPAYADGANPASAFEPSEHTARAQVQLLQSAALIEAARKATTTTTVVRRAAPTPRPAPRNLGAQCNVWLTGAGVTDLASATNLIARESGCNPYAVNPLSGACNVAQELPCGKSGCVLGDGACSVRWMDGYVHARYGSWAAALNFQIRNGWY